MSEGIGSIGVSSTWHGSMSFCVVEPLESVVEVDEEVGASVVVPSVVVPSEVDEVESSVVGSSVVDVTSELSLSLPLPLAVVVVVASVVVVIPCDAEVMFDMLSPSLAEALGSSPLQALRTRAQAQRVMVPRACVGGIDRRISAPG